MAKINIVDEIVRLYILQMEKAEIAKYLNLGLVTVEWVIKKYKSNPDYISKMVKL